MAGEAPVAPTAPAAPASTEPTAQPPAAPPARDWGAEYKRLEAEHSRKVREHIIERRKWDADRKTTGERLSRLSELEKRENMARLNPTEFARSVWGDDWHEKLTEAKVHGVPPADLVASEMARVREEFEGKLAARDQAEKLRAEQAQAAQLEQHRAAMRSDAQEWLAANAKEYPLLEQLGAADKVARRIAERIEHEFHRSTQRDDSGQVTRRGQLLSIQAAAELIEGDLIAIAERAAGAAKYRDRLAPKLAPLQSPTQPATVAVTQVPQQQSRQQQTSGQQQPRKTLTNDIGAKTSGEARRLTESERREKALAAYEAEHAKRRTT